MTASDYGRLVENSKTNFAQTVVSKSVESLTQQVRRQRIQRERTSFVEQARHELDNSTGTDKIRGIYQWVDKRYSLRVLNYGKRLMYDVVVPEPAAFLVQALKNAVQPERFQLTKPLDPNLSPGQLNTGNYAWYAARYGVTGSVTPPPESLRRDGGARRIDQRHRAHQGLRRRVGPGISDGVQRSRCPRATRRSAATSSRSTSSYYSSRCRPELEVFIGERLLRAAGRRRRTCAQQVLHDEQARPATSR